MRLNPIALAIPAFLAAMGVELLVARARRRRLYRLQDSIADLGCGVGQQIAGLFFAASLLAAYEWVFRRAALVRFADGSGWPWLVAFVWVDVAYYWWHRLSHRVNFLWAVHAVHHQSEEFNLAVALRQAILSPVTSFPFYLPMALLGVPTLAYAAVNAFSTLYQFWIHTELVGKLGPAELVLNTPSAHRVHHAVNPRYLDRNYAAVLVVWDRLFGTYASERERPVYGVTKPIGSFNPLWAQAQPWSEVVSKARALGGLDRLRIWWKPPDWSAAGPVRLPSEEEVQARPRFELPTPPRIRAYAFVQFAPLIAATFLLLLWGDGVRPATLAVCASLVFGTLLSVGGLLDGRAWAVPAEVARLAAVAVALVAFAPLPGGWRASAIAVPAVLGMAVWLLAEARSRAAVTQGDVEDRRTVNRGAEHVPGR
jgi:sterol desaturase/sphingolipid hydroxylase (fatty acid hydroxylase superfamily)